MELLKVFVGDAAPSSTSLADKNSMVKGDLMLLDATTHEVATGSSTSVVIAAYNDKGVYLSAPFTNASIKYLNYKKATDVTAAEASATAQITSTTGVVAGVVAGGTYSLGIQIKEDLRMGTYNKNTEVIASHVCPGTAASDIHEITSTLAKGFSANPLTSTGSPYQLVKVQRTATGAIVSAGNATVAPGARQVTFVNAHGKGVGDYVGLGGGIYQIERVLDTNSVILDTAYQGAGTTLTGGTAQGTSAAGTFAAKPSTITFSFTAVPQTQKNRYDQFRMVDFVVITPKGNDPQVFAITKNDPVYPIGSYRQVRDLEEKAHTQSMPLINYREFPFETFPLNADPTFSYNLLTISYTAGWGYNMMQSNQAEFLHTVVVAAPNQANSHFDGTPASGSTFATVFDTWYSGAAVFGNI
jgi:hypothetical protein